MDPSEPAKQMPTVDMIQQENRNNIASSNTITASTDDYVESNRW